VVPTAVKLFVGYVRVSTNEQAASGLGLEAQQDRVRAYVAARGGVLRQVFVDAGLSGTLPPAKRPALRELLAFLERTPEPRPTLVVLRLDRLARNTRELLNLEHDLRRRRVGLASVCEEFDSNTPSGRMYLSVLASIGEYEAALAAERTHAAMKVALTHTTARVGGVAPFGYEASDNGQYRVVPAEADVLSRLVAAFLATRSFNSVANALNSHGHTTRNGKAWTHVAVGDLLRNVETYAGSRLWARTSRRNGPRDETEWVRVPEAHEAIVDPETAARVIAILEGRLLRRLARRQAALSPTVEGAG
jgi:site-specific DNA recombinase